MKRGAGQHQLTPQVCVFVFEGREHGPTVILQAGIHGDEIAGVHALQELVSEPPVLQRGRLIVIPIMNPAAYRARARKAPGGLDLNRCFPGAPNAVEPEKQLAHRFLQLAKDEEPMVVATLHESRELYHQSKAIAFGQTLVYGVEHRDRVHGGVETVVCVGAGSGAGHRGNQSELPVLVPAGPGI